MGFISCSEMNVMDDLGWRMELQRERNDHSSMLCFLRLYYQCDGRVKHSSGLDMISMQLKSR